MADAEPSYRLRVAARRDMQEIWRYTRARWGLRQAKAYRQKLTRAFFLLARNPSLGISYDDVRKKYRKKSVGRHVIYYQIERDGIVVACVLHGRMRAQRRIREAERD